MVVIVSVCKLRASPRSGRTRGARRGPCQGKETHARWPLPQRGPRPSRGPYALARKAKRESARKFPRPGEGDSFSDQGEPGHPGRWPQAGGTPRAPVCCFAPSSERPRVYASSSWGRTAAFLDGAVDDPRASSTAERLARPMRDHGLGRSSPKVVIDSRYPNPLRIARNDVGMRLHNRV
jgi:hypothetical protein